MKLFAPNNIFTTIFKIVLPAGVEVINKPSSLIVKELETNTAAIALIPSMDLLKNKNLLVSGKLGVSFDGLLSQSYFYFVDGQKSFDKIFLRGDVSLNELLLTKILFEERYSSTLELVLDTSAAVEKGRNYVISGDDNYFTSGYEKGMSLADEFSDMISLPYVNYVFASPDREALKLFENQIDSADTQIEDTIEKCLAVLNLTPSTRSFITSNIGSVYYDMLENEHDALGELIKLMYYHGIIDDMFDVKFV
jgi:hypothetical protein